MPHFMSRTKCCTFLTGLQRQSRQAQGCSSCSTLWPTFCRLRFACFFTQLIPFLPQVTTEKQICNKLLQGRFLRKVNRRRGRGGGVSKKPWSSKLLFHLPSNLSLFLLQQSSWKVPPPRLRGLVLCWAGFSKHCLCVLPTSSLVLPEDTGTHTHTSNASRQQSNNAIISQFQLPEPFQGSPNWTIDPEPTKKWPEALQEQTRPLERYLQPLRGSKKCQWDIRNVFLPSELGSSNVVHIKTEEENDVLS